MILLPITITQFLPNDQDEVKNLILAGMKEHWGKIDKNKNQDLNDIQSSYAKAVFLVAREEKRIIGCGALKAGPDHSGEIVRMSVAKDYRRRGVGRKILGKLINQAKILGYEKIILETTSAWEEVISFYLQCGFQISHFEDGNTYFKKDNS